MTGRGKRDAQGSNAPTIIIVGGKDGAHPWAKKAQEVVDAAIEKKDPSK